MSIKGKVKPGQQHGWLNIYRLESAPGITDTSLHGTPEEAQAKAAFISRWPNDIRFVATIEVSWEESE